MRALCFLYEDGEDRGLAKIQLNPDLRRYCSEVFREIADLIPMGMLDRYKKKGGFVQLLTLIETSGGKKQEQFLGLINQESPAWEQELKKKMLTVDRVFTWPQDVMSEILTRLQPLTLCVCLHGRSSEEIEKILTPLPPISKRKITDQMGELSPNPAEKATCEMKLITEVRSIVAAGYIKFEKFDADLFIEENIEERLNHSDSGLAYLNKIDINYSDDSKSASSSSSAQPSNSGGGGGGAEVEQMRRKVNQLMLENNSLKQEVHTLRDKLAQIKKIA